MIFNTSLEVESRRGRSPNSIAISVNFFMVPHKILETQWIKRAQKKRSKSGWKMGSKKGPKLQKNQ